MGSWPYDEGELAARVGEVRPCLGGRAPEHLFVQLGKLSAYRDLHIGGYRGDVFQCGVNPVRSLEGDGSSPLVDHRG